MPSAQQAQARERSDAPVSAPSLNTSFSSVAEIGKGVASAVKLAQAVEQSKVGVWGSRVTAALGIGAAALCGWNAIEAVYHTLTLSLLKAGGDIFTVATAGAVAYACYKGFKFFSGKNS